MKPSPRGLEAIQRIAVTPEGRELCAYLRAWYEADLAALMMSEIPEQTRRLQGTARRMSEVLSLFESSRAP